MAKVLVTDDQVEIHAGWLGRLLAAEQSRTVPLAEIHQVTGSPPLIELILRWEDQRGSWLTDASTYDGHMIPNAVNPERTLAIELKGAGEKIFVEVEDESPQAAAARVQEALRRLRPATDAIPMPAASEETGPSTRDQLATLVAEAVARDMREGIEDSEEIEDGELSARASRPSLLTVGPGEQGLTRAAAWLFAAGIALATLGAACSAAGIRLGLVLLGAGVAAGLTALSTLPPAPHRGD